MMMKRTVSHMPKKVRASILERGFLSFKRTLRATLSDALREKYKRRSLAVRKGDTVKILRGDFRNIEGKVTAVYPKEGRIAVEGVTREKVKGGTVQLTIHASKVMLTNLNLDDKRRRALLEGKE